MFDAIAAGYDRLNRILSFGMDRSWRKKLASHLPTKNQMKLLDLACGTGDQMIAILEKNRSIGKIYGVDLSSEMMAIGKKKIDKKPYHKKVRWQIGDAMNLPFEDESFDAISFSFGIRNVEKPKQSLKEIFRVLKPKGRCLILEFAIPTSFWKKKIHLFYLRHILPRIGGLFSDPKAYRYLNQTIETFPCGDAFTDWMKEVGFQKNAFQSLSFGAVHLYVGEKR